jgi:hypothetical protein
LVGLIRLVCHRLAKTNSNTTRTSHSNGRSALRVRKENVRMPGQRSVQVRATQWSRVGFASEPQRPPRVNGKSVQLQNTSRGISGMKTFLTVLVYVLLALLAIKLLPFLLLPVLIGGVGLLIAAGLTFGGVALVAGVGVAAVVLVIGLLIVLLAVLAPIWIPILAIVGLIALIRGSNHGATT